MSDIYSYHTFIFPLIWEGRGKQRIPLAKILSIFDNNVNWVKTDMSDEHHITSNPELISKDDELLFYKEYQYFHPYARKAIYGFDKDIVSNYSFRPDIIRNNAHYYIEKNDGKVRKKYDLILNAIKLSIYNTGVALFILECENHGEGSILDNDGKEKAKLPQNNLNAVKEINDYGRRVTLPFIPNASGGYFSLTADRLTLDIKGFGTFISDFRGFAEEVDSLSRISNVISLTHFCDFIKDILSFGSDIEFSSKLTDDKNSYYIYPALDDRMFIACYICDEKALEPFCRRYDNGNLRCLESEYYSKSLHELIAVDLPGCCCTMDPLLRKAYLQEHMYNRWLDEGTLTTITNQALINLTTAGTDSYLADNFLTQYIPMCCLCLVQRASIINFQRRISEISARVEERGRQIKLSTVSDIMKLQERFVAFQNQLCFTEVTPQDQGIEMYNKLMECCFIEKEITALKDQLQSLCDAANTSLDYNFNKYALIFAVPTLFTDVVFTVIDSFHRCDNPAICDVCNVIKGVKFGCVVLAILIVIMLLTIYRRRK